MDTGQLEAVLPQWLREVRQQARESAEEDAEQAQTAEVEASKPDEPDKPADLLAGLQSQSEDDEEVPDWLAGLRGETEQTATEEESTEDDDLAALRNMLGDDAPVTQETEVSELPGWVSGMDAEETGQEVGDDLSALLGGGQPEELAQAESQLSASASDFDWSADFDTDSGHQADSTEEDTTFDTDLPAWLQGAEETPKAETESELPSWIGTEEPAPFAESDEPISPVSEGELPGWLSALGEEDAESVSDEEKEHAEAKGGTDWLASLGDETGTAPQEEIEQPEAEGTTDWFSSLEDGTDATSQHESAQPATEGELPDWLSSLGEDESSEEIPLQATGESTAGGDTPDWLSSLGEESSDEIFQQEAEEPTASGGTPDWLSSLGEESSDEISESVAGEPAAVGDTPDWLSSLGEDSSEEAPQQETGEPVASSDTPDWLSSLGEVESDTQEPVAQSTAEGELPDWLSSLGDEEVQEKDEELAPAGDPVEIPQPVTEEETPDWLSSMGQETTETEQPTEETEVSSITSDEPVADATPLPAFVDDEGQPISTDDVESLFSMDMPDWLSDTEGQSDSGALGAEGAQVDDLRPAELPSWVQAMRPVESVISETEGEPIEEQPMEEKGPLAGLRGVLPAVPGVGPSSKPKAYSLKLQASADQQANATMLEQMLAEEIHPKPVSTQKVVQTQRFLRWAIAVLLLIVVGGTVFSGMQINPIPATVPPETSAVLDYVKGGLPANAPVLLIFDYEPALAGEMEASAAPLVDLMLTLKAPRLSLLASTPTGSGLAERFIKPFSVPTGHNYQRGQQFINLGYLPGGAAGVLAFSENPINTKPLSTSGENAWATSLLQDVKSLSEFRAIILLTDNVETARVWIEQTEGKRGETPLLVVSSAQSGPMILPYVQSGQVDGMVTGLDNSAPIEQGNSGRPGMARRYWDAYGFGLLTAVSLIVLGSLWSLGAGLQARRKEQGEE